MHRREILKGLGGAALLPLAAKAAAAQTPPRQPSGLVPQTRTGHAGFALDFPGLSIGTADYVEGPTGCTVFSFARPAMAEIDVRGGAPGTVGDHYGACDAICLAGGSAMGLEAASGVAAELFERRGQPGQPGGMPLVLGAVIYDFGIRPNWIYPDKALGRAAFRAATSSFPMGRVGAGSSATVGKAWNPKYRGETAGQGGAVAALGLTRIGVFTVVNALGAIFDRNGRVVRGNRDENGLRAGLADGIAAKVGEPPQGNTTLTVMVTNQRFERTTLRQIGRQVHSSMARAIQPFHGRNDGDVLYAVSTFEVDNPRVSDFTLAAVAGELAWDAVLRCYEPS
jgi:L-aminopeptidase/D-esterase-like protein